MTIKTPEQVAAMYAQFVYAAAHEVHVTDVGASDAGLAATERAILATIEADRAQRADPLARVRAVLDAEIGWETPAALKDRIEWAVGDDEEPTSADERDYGKYLDQQFWGDRD